MKKRTFLKAAGLTLSSAATAVHAQGTSGRPVRIVVPLPAGTSTDLIARSIMQVAGPLLGQQIVVENKAGANGAIGAMEVVRSAPDGLTILHGSLSAIATNVAFVKNLPYDPRRDFTPIANVTFGCNVLVVKANSPLRTFADFIALAKQNPGKVSIGSSTSFVQTAIASMNKVAGIQLLTVPYKGVPAFLTDIIGGVLDAGLSDPGNAIAQVKAGQLRALAVTSAKRLSTMPEVPSIGDTFPGYDFVSWNAFVGPAGMPRELVNRWAAAIGQAVKNPEVAQRLEANGTPVWFLGPDELKTYIDSEITKYVRLAKEAGIEPE